MSRKALLAWLTSSLVACGGDSIISPEEIQQRLVVENVTYAWEGPSQRVGHVVARVLVQNPGRGISDNTYVTLRVIVFDASGNPLGENDDLKRGFLANTQELFEINFWNLDSPADLPRIASESLFWETEPVQ